MKLATYQDGSRDGQLLVVSRDLATAHYATGIAHTLQQVLDDWNFYAPQLQDLFDALNSGKTRHAFPFNPKQCMAPLPRAYQRVEGQAFVQHLELLHQAAHTKVPASCYAEPLLHQGGGDNFCGPCRDVLCASEADGIDFEAGVAVVTTDVRMAATLEQALESIRLVMLVNNISLRRHIPAELGVGLLQGKPVTAFSPVAVTLDELGDDWRKGRLSLTVQSTWNGRRVGLCNAGPEMTFHFGQLIAQLCKTRPARAGTVVGSGAISNKDRSHGYSCIAEKRATETIQDGQSVTEFMKYGDTIRIEAKGRDGRSLFGAIEQEVVPLAELR